MKFIRRPGDDKYDNDKDDDNYDKDDADADAEADADCWFDPNTDS